MKLRSERYGYRVRNDICVVTRKFIPFYIEKIGCKLMRSEFLYFPIEHFPMLVEHNFQNVLDDSPFEIKRKKEKKSIICGGTALTQNCNLASPAVAAVERSSARKLRTIMSSSGKGGASSQGLVGRKFYIVQSKTTAAERAQLKNLILVRSVDEFLLLSSLFY